MSLSLISLSDDEIESVTTSVREWCRVRHCDVDSPEGRKALTGVIDLIQSKRSEGRVITELSQRLDRPSDTNVE
jgi:hypothetical protein